ncbi:MAG: DUF2339 domain-containing protein [Elusimicrobiales bacterium]|nr:DUF2339 domain-containing protein [Elusimicrobiales bacterium]
MGFEEQVRAETRFSTIEQRLAKLESFLNIPRPPTVPPPPPPPPAPAQPVMENMLSGATAVPAQRFAPVRKERSGNWLGVVGIVCFVLAAAFIIKLSIDSGWLTPERQIGLAVLFGLGLIGAGFALMKSDSEYASLLPGAGIIVLYLTVFAAHRLYSLITFEAAISMASIVSGGCIWLYTQIKEDMYPITAAIGSYCAPLILSLGSESTFSVYYFLLCSLSFSVISIWVQSRTLTLISAYLAIFMTAAIGLGLGQDKLIAGMLVLHFLVFSAGTYLYTRQNGKPLTETESNSFLPVLLFFYATEYYFIERIKPDLAPWLSLGFAAFLFVLYLAARKRFPEGSLGSQPLVLSFITVVCFHSFYLELLPADARPWLFVAIALVLAVPGVNLAARKSNSAYRVPALGLLAVLVIEYLSMVSHLLSGNEMSWLAVSLVSVGSLWVLIDFKGGDLDPHNGYAPLLGAAHLLAVLGLYRLTKDAGSLEVSASWLFYAVCVIGYAFSRRDEVMAKSAMFVLGFAAGKALLYDAASAPTVVRIMCLLLTGAALYGSGFLIRRISGWKAEKAAQPAAEKTV